MLQTYLDFRPRHGSGAQIAPSAILIGRTEAGTNLVLRALATLRADGESITVGDDVFFDERSTVHIADGLIPARVGDRATVGRFALVHACTLDEGVVIGDAAVIMDGAHVGAWAVLAAGCLVPPRKDLPGGFLYAGNPAAPLRAIARTDVENLAAAMRAGTAGAPLREPDLPPAFWAGAAAAHSCDDAFVASTAVLRGRVQLQRDASVFFGCVVDAGGGLVTIGAGSNIQDNSLLLAGDGDIAIGAGVTVGHNVRMASAEVGDDALIGMGSQLQPGVVVEPGGAVGARALVESGTRVRSGWIWAGRPARAFRELKDAERAAFARFRDIYVGYSVAYRTSGNDRTTPP